MSSESPRCGEYSTPSLVLSALLCCAVLIPRSALAIPHAQSTYRSELEAVKAATDLYNPISIRQDREFMGAIYRSGRYFRYSVFANARGVDRFTFSVPGEHRDTLVAFWHTHGDASPLHQYFSQFDTRMVRQLRKPLYLADFTGVLKVFRPGSRVLSGFAAGRYGLPRSRGYALGEVVKNKDAEPVGIATRPAPGAAPQSYC
ncbi:MAG: hypothetical protein PsegKO_22530 [Pseudohongiellaceae bacterium]